MRPHSFARTLTALAFVAIAANAEAGDFAFSGNFVMNTDLVNIDFSVAGSSPVSLWTDSFRSGLNFDPQLTLWQQVAGSYRLVTSNDDNDSISSSQGFQDAGIATTLGAGTYKLTLSASSYQAVGSQLSQGFQFDPFFIPALVATPIATWNQPSYDPDLNNQKGTLWSVHLSGANLLSAAVSPVPEPASITLALAGVLFIFAWRRQHRG